MGKKISVFRYIDAKRDWGFAEDYVEAMWLMMQSKKPDDYVVATKTQHSIRDFLKLAFEEVGIDNWKKYVKIDKKFKRPLDVKSLCGDFEKLKKNWDGLQKQVSKTL